jgi:hypothetical protein
MDQTQACPYCPGCPLYAQFKSQNFLNTFKALYCESDFTSCERYKLRVSGAPVPATLMPNGKDLGDFQHPST